MQTKTSQKRSFKTTVLATALLLTLSPAMLHAQIQDRPRVGPELRQLEALVGEWTYEGVVSDTPLGPGGKFAGKQTTQMVLDGLFQESRSEDKGVYGGKEIVYKGVNMTWFDSSSKSFLSHGYDNDGFVTSGVMTISGSHWTTTGSQTDSKGKTYKNRFLTTLSADRKKRIIKAELSADDGKTWIKYWDLEATKVSQ